MKLSIASVLLSLVLVSVSGRPLDSRQTRNNSNRKQMGNASGVAAGAAYFITNEPDGNFIVAADIGNDGKLTLRRAIGTGGLGEHGITDPNGPDPLFTQGAIKASSAANVLATVNPGSNTLSLFTIDPNDPTNLQLIGAPVGSGGEFPVSLAFNKDGSQLCALNGGAINGVNCFAVDKQKGLVSSANTNRALNLNQTTPATGPAGSVSHIVFSEDGQTLVASVKGVPPTPGFLAAWAIQQDGSLSDDFQKIDPADGGLLPFSMTVIPGKNAILATDAGLGFDIFDFGGNASSAVKIDGQSATCWSSFSKKTGNFYLTDIGTSIVTEVNVDDKLTGTIVKQYAQGQGTGTIDNDIVTVGINDFMYVLAANATTIDVLALNAPGKAQTIQKLGVAAAAQKANLKLSAFNVQGMTTFVRQ